MRQMDELFAALGRSGFRRRFRLGAREAAYLRQRGIETIMEHARQFVESRLADAEPANDGRQTPMRKHPVFIAQHFLGKAGHNHVALGMASARAGRCRPTRSTTSCG